MKIHQIYTYNDLRNFTYVLEVSDQHAIVLDPWDAEVVNTFLSDKSLSLKAVINTHEHWDHTRGNEALVAAHQCEVWAHKNGEGKIPGMTRALTAGETIELAPAVVMTVMDTPGHTFAHLCFLITTGGEPEAVFTGDTLFNAGVGNCHNGGSPEALYQTVRAQFHTLSDAVIVYPGHDYLENNLRFTLHLEPSNTVATQWLGRVAGNDPGQLQALTTIGDERSINAFFRLGSEEIRQNLALDNANDEATFLALRKRRNDW